MKKRSKKVDAKTAAATLQPQGNKLDEDGTSAVKTLREAWNAQPGPTENANPALRAMEMLETTHGQASRDVFSRDAKKAMGGTNNYFGTKRTRAMHRECSPRKPWRTARIDEQRTRPADFGNLGIYMAVGRRNTKNEPPMPLRRFIEFYNSAVWKLTFY